MIEPVLIGVIAAAAAYRLFGSTKKFQDGLAVTEAVLRILEALAKAFLR